VASEKVSLTLDEDVLSSARNLVGRRGLSRYVNRAVRWQVQRDGIAALLEDLDKEFGPVDPKAMEEVRTEWPDPAPKANRRRSA